MSMFKKLGKNTKILIFSAIGLVVLGAVSALLLMLPAEKETTPEDDTSATETTNTGDLVFTDKSSAETVSLKVGNSDGSYTITGIKSDGTSEYSNFFINELVYSGAPLKSESINSVIKYVSSFSAKQLVEENAQDLEKYGLQSPLATAEITFNDGTSASFGIGTAAPTGSFTYICRTGSNDVYIAATYYVSGLYNTRYDYIETALSVAYDFNDLEQASIAKITVKKTGEDDVVIETIPPAKDGEAKIGFNTHKFTQPLNLEIDVSDGESLIYGMYGLTATKAVRAELDEVDYEISGLNEPSCVVEMQVGGKVYSLSLGFPVISEKEDENGVITKTLDGYYGIYSGAPDVLYLFPPSALPWLDINFESVMAKLFLMPYIYSVSDVILETQNEELHFEIKKSAAEDAAENDRDFYLNGELLADPSRFKSLYQYLISVKAENLYTQPAVLPLIARYTYKYNDASQPDDVVEIYESDDRKIIIYLNGTPMFKCRALYATRLLQNIDAYLNGGEINTSW